MDPTNRRLWLLLHVGEGPPQEWIPRRPKKSSDEDTHLGEDTTIEQVIHLYPYGLSLVSELLQGFCQNTIRFEFSPVAYRRLIMETPQFQTSAAPVDALWGVALVVNEELPEGEIRVVQRYLAPPMISQPP